jgi:hypothetical protein
MQQRNEANNNGDVKNRTSAKRKTSPFRRAMGLLGALALCHGVGNTVHVQVPGTKTVSEYTTPSGDSVKVTCTESMSVKLWADNKRKRGQAKKPESV